MCSRIHRDTVAELCQAPYGMAGETVGRQAIDVVEPAVRVWYTIVPDLIRRHRDMGFHGQSRRTPATTVT